MKNLSNGLVLRKLKDSDRDSLLKHANVVYGDGTVGTGLTLLTSQLLDYYPDFSLEDNFVVVDTKNQEQIVSWLCLIRKNCVFGNKMIPYGQMDMVGTSPEYRNKGLIRNLNIFLEIRAEQYNIPFLVVLGIPYFYKKLGYEYAIPLEESISIPKEKIIKLKENANKRYKIERVSNEAVFKTYIKIRSKRNAYLDLYQIIHPSSFNFYNIKNLRECDEGRHFYLIIENDLIVGNFFLVNRFGYLRIRELYIEDKNAIPTVLIFAGEYSDKLNVPLKVAKPVQNELIQYLEHITGKKFAEPYAWLVKIPSFTRFFNHIAPILENRLQSTIYDGLSQVIKINYYEGGILLIFQEGRLISVRELDFKELKTYDQKFDLYIPPQNLTQLLLGYKTIDTFDTSNYDILYPVNKKNLLETLFPLIKASLTPTI